MIPFAVLCPPSCFTIYVHPDNLTDNMTNIDAALIDWLFPANRSAPTTIQSFASSAAGFNTSDGLAWATLDAAWCLEKISC